MLNEISGRTQTDFATVPGAGQKPQGATGKLIGRAVVQVVTPQSIFEDSVEELSASLNRSSDYALKNRKERSRTDSSMKERLKAFRRVAEENAADEGKALEELSQAIVGKPDREDILKEALERHEEPAEAWASLEEVRGQLAEKGADPHVLTELDEALVLMEMRYGAAIRAGVTGALVAAQGYVSLGSPLELGSTYRKAVLEFTGTMALYAHVQENYGGDFDKAVHFLYASLTADMACDEPSVDKASLESVNTSLGKLRSFQSAHAQCDSQMRRWQEIHHVHNCGMTGIDLLGKVLSLGGQTFIGASQVDDIAREAAATNVEHRILFLQELQRNIRTFSPLVFDNADGRTRVLDAVQGAVDNAVAEEDALLASEE